MNADFESKRDRRSTSRFLKVFGNTIS